MTSQLDGKKSVKVVLVTGILIASVIGLTWTSLTSNKMMTPSFTPSRTCDCEMTRKDNSTNRKHTRAKEQSRDIITPAPDEKCIKRLPQAIVVGIQKCGTTSLLRFLNDHPQIAACVFPAEVQYFSGHYEKSLDWYRNMMPCSYASQVTMEKSPPYFYREVCAERIRKMDPKTKIIITLKEPVERAISMYAMLKDYDKVGGLSFEDYITIKNRTQIDIKSKMVDFSNYAKHMKSWLKNFDLSQILIIDGHRLISNPSYELQRVENFLNIGSYFTPDRFVYNATKGMYCIIKSGVTSCMSSKKGRPHPEVNNRIRKKLQKYFKPLNEKFFKMIGRRFEWGY